MSMKERPIPFSAPMVRAILAGHKSMTRRVVKPQSLYRGDVVDPTGITRNGWWWTRKDGTGIHSQPTSEAAMAMLADSPYWCPYGRVGDRLWVREEFAASLSPHPSGVIYRASSGADMNPFREGYTPWKRWFFLPRLSSRITLEIAGVDVERVQEITARDAAAEGLAYYPAEFEETWDKLNAARGFGWEVNPWVWVIAFKDVSNEGKVQS